MISRRGFFKAAAQVAAYVAVARHTVVAVEAMAFTPAAPEVAVNYMRLGRFDELLKAYYGEVFLREQCMSQDYFLTAIAKTRANWHGTTITIPFKK